MGESLASILHRVGALACVAGLATERPIAAVAAVVSAASAADGWTAKRTLKPAMPKWVFHTPRIARSALSHKGFLLCSQTCKAA